MFLIEGRNNLACIRSCGENSINKLLFDFEFSFIFIYINFLKYFIFHIIEMTNLLTYSIGHLITPKKYNKKSKY